MNEEDKKYKEQMKSSGQKFAEKIEEKQKKELIKKFFIKFIGVKTVMTIVFVVIISSFLGIVFLASAKDDIERVTYERAVETKENLIKEEALGEIIELDEGKYKISYDGKTGRDAIEAILEENEMNFSDFTEDEIECLYKCLKAEWATTYPNLGESVDNKDLDNEYIQGLITIKRGKIDGTIENLTYKPYEEFKEIKDAEALKYFSIKDSNIIIANWTTNEIKFDVKNYKYNGLEQEVPTYIKDQYIGTGEEINISETPISYKDMIGVHIAPFEVFTALLVTTGDVDFVNELADLALDSKLEITVYDNATENVSTEEEYRYEKRIYDKLIDYTINTVIETKVVVDPDEGTEKIDTSYTSSKYTNENILTQEEEIEYSIETKIITKQNSYILGLSNVKSWIGEIKNEYVYKESIGDETDLGLGDEYAETFENVEELETNDVNALSFANSKKSTVTSLDGKKVTRKTCTIDKVKLKTTYIEKNKLNKNTTRTNKYGFENTTKQTINIGKEFEKIYDKNEKAKAILVESSTQLLEFLGETETVVDYVSIMQYLIYICTGEDFGVTQEEILKLTEDNQIMSYQSLGNISAFGCTLTREQFISLAKTYKSSDTTYQSKMADYAGDFYDVCTKYNVNPVIAYAHACLETGFGNAIPYNNYFGMAVYNGAASGSRYSTPKESVEDYCKWVQNNATIGNSAYAQNVKRAEEWGKENPKLLGTPDNNIYALYCRYAYLGDTHLCNDDMDSPRGEAYYIENGSNWGSGGRIYIHYMYEKGGLYTGQYKTLCGHENASDPTTIREKADYVEYCTNKRIKIATDIFGNVLESSNGNISSSNDSDKILEIAEDTFNKIVKTDKKPYNQSYAHNITWPYTSGTIDCSSFLGVVLYRLGYTDFGGAQKNSSWWYYSSDATIKKYGWQTFYINGPEDINKLEPGDILAYNGTVTGNYAGFNFSGNSRNHVQIVQSVNVNKVYAWDCGYYPVTKREGPDKSNNIYFWGFHGKKGVKVIRIIDID